MVIHFGGTLSAMEEISINTPTDSPASKYAAFDGFRRLRQHQSSEPSVRAHSQKKSPEAALCICKRYVYRGGASLESVRASNRKPNHKKSLYRKYT
jgi:hypothetical protein